MNRAEPNLLGSKMQWKRLNPLDGQKRMLICYPKLLCQYWKIGKHDGIIVGYAGCFDVILARLFKQ